MPQPASCLDVSQAISMSALYPSHVLITAAEAEDLLDYMQHQYVCQTDHPALWQLLDRLARIRQGSVGW